MPLWCTGRSETPSDATFGRTSGVTDSTREGATRNLVSISPFFIVKDLQASIAFYRERLGFQLDFDGPAGDVYYAGVSRDGIGIMLFVAAPGRRHRVEPAVLDYSDAQRVAKKHDLIASTGLNIVGWLHPNGAVAPDGRCDHGRRGARLIWRVRLTVTGFR